jgi:hypothetical protein
MFKVPNVQAVQSQPEADPPSAELLHAPFNSPTSFLPRVAGEDEGGGLNDWNGLNVLNGHGMTDLLAIELLDPTFFYQSL